MPGTRGTPAERHMQRVDYETYLKLMSIGHAKEAEYYYKKYVAEGGVNPRVTEGAKPTNATNFVVAPPTPAPAQRVVALNLGTKPAKPAKPAGMSDSDWWANNPDPTDRNAAAGTGGGEAGQALKAANDAAIAAVLAAHGITGGIADAPNDVKLIASQAGVQAGQMAYSAAQTAGLSDYTSGGTAPKVDMPTMHIDTTTGNVTANASMATKFESLSLGKKAGIFGAVIVGGGMLLQKVFGKHKTHA